MAVFLVGGPSVDEKPSAVYLRSGDIAVMSRASRLSYHAVPRIMKSDTLPSWHPIPTDGIKRRKIDDEPDRTMALDTELWESTAIDSDWQPFDEYVEQCRININVRQVLRDGQASLVEDDEISKHENKL